jgi:hypothetical protein
MKTKRRILKGGVGFSDYLPAFLRGTNRAPSTIVSPSPAQNGPVKLSQIGIMIDQKLNELQPRLIDQKLNELEPRLKQEIMSEVDGKLTKLKEQIREQLFQRADQLENFRGSHQMLRDYFTKSVDNLKSQFSALQQSITSSQSKLMEEMSHSSNVAIRQLGQQINTDVSSIQAKIAEIQSKSEKISSDVARLQSESASTKEQLSRQIQQEVASLKQSDKDLNDFFGSLARGMSTIGQSDAINKRNIQELSTALAATKETVDQTIQQTVQKFQEQLGKTNRDLLSLTGRVNVLAAELPRLKTALTYAQTKLEGDLRASQVQQRGFLLEKLTSESEKIAKVTSAVEALSLKTDQVKRASSAEKEALAANLKREIASIKNELQESQMVTQNDIVELQSADPSISTTDFEARIKDLQTNLSGQISAIETSLGGRISGVEQSFSSVSASVNSLREELQSQLARIDETDRTINGTFAAIRAAVTETGRVGIQNTEEMLQELSANLIDRIAELKREVEQLKLSTTTKDETAVAASKMYNIARRLDSYNEALQTLETRVTGPILAQLRDLQTKLTAEVVGVRNDAAEYNRLLQATSAAGLSGTDLERISVNSGLEFIPEELKGGGRTRRRRRRSRRSRRR